MKKIIYFLLFTQYLWAAEPAAKAPAPAAKAAPKAKYKKNTTMEFEGRSVDGNVVNPDSADVEGDKNVRFDPLLEGRKDFKREFKRSSGVTR
jgi:hypothetical protein